MEVFATIVTIADLVLIVALVLVWRRAKRAEKKHAHAHALMVRSDAEVHRLTGKNANQAVRLGLLQTALKSSEADLAKTRSDAEEFTERAERYVVECVSLFEEFARRVDEVRALITDPAAEKVWNDIALDDRLADIRPHLLTVRHAIIAAATALPLPTIEPPIMEHNAEEIPQ